MRPKQWVKNVLVFAAPGAAGRLHQPEVLAASVACFAAFCLAAGGTYLLNDAADADADRAHPKKRHRPVAAGIVPVMLARILGGFCLLAGVGVALSVNVYTGMVLGAYVALTTMYTGVLKHISVVELVTVAAGFVLRAVSGASASSIPVSSWFFVVVLAGALLMVSSKRTAELALPGAHRRVLAGYTASFLHTVRTTAMGVALVAYCMWAFDPAGGPDAGIWVQLSLAPFTTALLRWSQLADAGLAGSPEEVVPTDRLLQLCGVCWVTLFALGVYG